MSSIPLPALDLRPQQSADPLQSIGRLIEMKSLLNSQQMQAGQLQLQQQQIKDQQALTNSLRNWDPSTQSYDDLAHSVIQNGGSGNAALQIQQHALSIKKTVSDIAAQDATSGSKNLETFIGKQKAIGNLLEAHTQVPDEQLHDWTLGQIDTLSKNGILDPPHAQQLSQAVQQTQDPQQLRSLIDQAGKSALGAQQVAEQQKTVADTARAQQETSTSKATQAKTELETSIMQQYGTPAQQEAKYISLQTRKNQGAPMLPSETAFMKAYEHNKTLVPVANFNLQNAGAGTVAQPSAMAQAVANGTMKWQDVISPRTPMSVKNQFAQEVKSLNPNFDTSTFTIEQKAAEKATSGAWADTRLAYNTAIDHANQLLTASDALKNGDVKKLNSLSNYFKTEFGSPDVTNFQAIANAYNHEVTSVVSKGHITDAEVAQGHGVLPDNASPEQIRGVAQAYKNLMTSKRDELDKLIKAGAGNKADSVLNVQAGGGETQAETKTYQGHTYTRSKPTDPWQLKQ